MKRWFAGLGVLRFVDARSGGRVPRGAARRVAAPAALAAGGRAQPRRRFVAADQRQQGSHLG
ncbi:MAG TPA: hypothetical protein VGB08_03185, partial [Allosphingosinicella sp.]